MAVLLASHCVGYHGLETSTQLWVDVLVHCICVDTSLLPLLSLSARLTLMSQQVRTGLPSSQEWTQSLTRVSTARALTTRRPCAVLCCAVVCCAVLWCGVVCCAVRAVVCTTHAHMYMCTHTTHAQPAGTYVSGLLLPQRRGPIMDFRTS